MTAMEAFHKRVPNIGMSEYRSFTALGIEGLPRGQYGFMEFYCNDPSCDCRRVQLVVVAPEVSKRFLATISYGWESLAFYKNRFDFISEKDSPCEPTLEPLGDQSQYSEILLDCCKRFLLSDEAYIERLKRHYRLFKKTQSSTRGSNRTPSRRKGKKVRSKSKRKRR